MPSVILVFSTLLLDENLQQPVVLPKQDIQLHLSPKVRQDANLPVFHFLTVCQTNTKHQSLMVIDSEHEIQFGVHQPNSAPVEGGLVSTIITLYQPPQKSEYVPHLVGNVFENVVQVSVIIHIRIHRITINKTRSATTNLSPRWWHHSSLPLRFSRVEGSVASKDSFY